MDKMITERLEKLKKKLSLEDQVVIQKTIDVLKATREGLIRAGAAAICSRNFSHNVGKVLAMGE